MKIITEKVKASFDLGPSSTFLSPGEKVCVLLHHLKKHTFTCRYIVYSYIVYSEYAVYYFYYLYVCINGIVRYASFYNLTFSLNIFLSSINTDMYNP